MPNGIVGFVSTGFVATLSTFGVGGSIRGTGTSGVAVSSEIFTGGSGMVGVTSVLTTPSVGLLGRFRLVLRYQYGLAVVRSQGGHLSRSAPVATTDRAGSRRRAAGRLSARRPLPPCPTIAANRLAWVVRCFSAQFARRPQGASRPIASRPATAWHWAGRRSPWRPGNQGTVPRRRGQGRCPAR